MTTRPPTVSAHVQLRLLIPGTAALPVRADLRYDVSDPYAVQWTFARQLLSQGVAAPSGEGDVQVWPSSNSGSAVVCLSLSSPSGRALFEVPLSELVQFLGQTYETVPTGGESAHVDIDAELALLLWAEPET
jgi:hypothetical protein